MRTDIYVYEVCVVSIYWTRECSGVSLDDPMTALHDVFVCLFVCLFIVFYVTIIFIKRK